MAYYYCAYHSRRHHSPFIFACTRLKCYLSKHSREIILTQGYPRGSSDLSPFGGVSRTSLPLDGIARHLPPPPLHRIHAYQAVQAIFCCRNSFKSSSKFSRDAERGNV